MKKYRNVFKSNLSKTKKARAKTYNDEKLNGFTRHTTKLLSYMMIILKLHKRLNVKQFMKKELEY